MTKHGNANGTIRLSETVKSRMELCVQREAFVASGKRTASWRWGKQELDGYFNPAFPFVSSKNDNYKKYQSPLIARAHDRFLLASAAQVLMEK